MLTPTCLAFAALALACATAAHAGVLDTLRPEHPRILLTKESLATLKKDLADPAAPRAAVAKAMIARADKILADKKNRVSYTIVGPRLLTESRRNLENVSILSLASLLTGEKKYADLATSEMLAAAAFKDWNPSHFLDTAEMTTALAIGYDWLYDTLSPDDRAAIRAAIVRHGLAPGKDCYDGKVKHGWWTRATHNWAQVCNGGLATGALAIARDGKPDDDQLCEFVLSRGLECVRPAYAHWDKDGGWDEGPGYWGYTIRYTAYHMAALESATGSMHGLEKSPGLENAGRFRMHFIGPTGKTFNFADAGDNAGRSPEMFFMARVFQQPWYAAHHRAEMLDSPLDVIWYQPEAPDVSPPVPTSAHFRGVNVAFFRTDWDNPKATWVGIKGGDNGANHSHLDLGTFVIDSLGKRWALDLGSDEYNMPGYFGAQRFTYYRLKTEGHNTVLIDGANQPPKARAAITRFDADRRLVVIDLTAAYPAATRVTRGLRLLDANKAPAVLIQDEIEAAQDVAISSLLHTPAKVTLDGSKTSATLQIGEDKMRLELLSPAPATLEAHEVVLAPPQKPLKGVTRISVVLKDKARSARIAMRLVPLVAQDVPHKVTPISDWQ